MTTPFDPNTDTSWLRRPARANVLLVDSRVAQAAFEKALTSVPEIEITSVSRTGSQTNINLEVSDQKSGEVLNFLRETILTLPGFSVRIQGATLAPMPTVVCKAAVATTNNARRSRFKRTRSVSTTQPVVKPGAPGITRPTGATEVPGIRPEPASVFAPRAPRVSMDFHPPSIVDIAVLWQIIRGTLVAVLFLFGDVELALAKWHRRRHRATTAPKFNLKNAVATSGKNSLIGTGFIFGDVELAYRKLRQTKPALPRQRVADVVVFLGVIALLTRALIESVLGHAPAETEQPNENQKR